MWTQPRCSGCVRVPVQANNYLLLRYKTSTSSNLIARKLSLREFVTRLEHVTSPQATELLFLNVTFKPIVSIYTIMIC